MDVLTLWLAPGLDTFVCIYASYNVRFFQKGVVVFLSKNPEAGRRGTKRVLSGQQSGKSRHAEALAQRWLQADAAHPAVLQMLQGGAA